MAMTARERLSKDAHWCGGHCEPTRPKSGLCHQCTIGTIIEAEGAARREAEADAQAEGARRMLARCADRAFTMAEHARRLGLHRNQRAYARIGGAIEELTPADVLGKDEPAGPEDKADGKVS